MHFNMNTTKPVADYTEVQSGSLKRIFFFITSLVTRVCVTNWNAPILRVASGILLLDDTSVFTSSSAWRNHA